VPNRHYNIIIIVGIKYSRRDITATEITMREPRSCDVREKVIGVSVLIA